jgi:hypothetical protein
MPNNGNFLTAAYIITAVILLSFAWYLWRASRR